MKKSILFVMMALLLAVMAGEEEATVLLLGRGQQASSVLDLAVQTFQLQSCSQLQTGL